MNQGKESGTQTRVNHPIFSAFYEWLFRGAAERYFLGSLRRDTAGKASGVVLEVDEGLGLNFPYYDPATVERVKATEPDAAMLRYARNHIKQTRVPVHRNLEGLLDGVYQPTAEHLTAMLDERHSALYCRER